MRLAALPWLALALVSAAPPVGGPAPGAALERWSWNARERTATGERALARGDAARAVGAFDTALRLRPEDPRTSFNAGTARLGGDDRAALPLLERAAETAAPELAPAAWYNLGNARLAERDAAGAVAAYTETLRRRPDDAAAKFNLELAQRELERQRRQQREQQQPRGGEPQAGEPSASAGENGRPPDAPPRPQAGSEGEPERAEGASSPPGSEDEPRRGESPAPGGGERPPSPLPQFHDLPDMTAEQAAAILRAVENLELAERRERAAREAAQRPSGDRDW